MLAVHRWLQCHRFLERHHGIRTVCWRKPLAISHASSKPLISNLILRIHLQYVTVICANDTTCIRKCIHVCALTSQKLTGVTLMLAVVWQPACRVIAANLIRGHGFCRLFTEICWSIDNRTDHYAGWFESVSDCLQRKSSKLGHCSAVSAFHGTHLPKKINSQSTKLYVRTYLLYSCLFWHKKMKSWDYDDYF